MIKLSGFYSKSMYQQHRMVAYSELKTYSLKANFQVSVS